MVTCDLFIAQVESVLFVSDTPDYTFDMIATYDPDVQPCGMSDRQMTHNNDIAYASWDFNPLATLQFV